jgi:hypothetical protein
VTLDVTTPPSLDVKLDVTPHPLAEMGGRDFSNNFAVDSRRGMT